MPWSGLLCRADGCQKMDNQTDRRAPSRGSHLDRQVMWSDSISRTELVVWGYLCRRSTMTMMMMGMVVVMMMMMMIIMMIIMIVMVLIKNITKPVIIVEAQTKMFTSVRAKLNTLFLLHNTVT